MRILTKRVKKKFPRKCLRKSLNRRIGMSLMRNLKAQAKMPIFKEKYFESCFWKDGKLEVVSSADNI